MSEQQTKKNRPTIRPRKRGILFHDEGPTGWGRIRRLGNYKGDKVEGNFSHLYDKVADEEE